MIAALIFTALGYIYCGGLAWILIDGNVDEDEAVGIATVWPLALIYWTFRMLFIGIRYWVRAMMRLSHRSVPAKKIAPDPILEAAKREVEQIAPTETD